MTADQARRRHRLAWLAGTTAAVAFIAWILMPKPELYGDISFSTLVTDRGRQPLKLLPAGDGRYRLFVALDDIAPVAREATLLYEDRRFYQHPGVDPIALARAAWTTYVARERPVGGSTITMQLARLRFGLDTRSPLGKLVQSARAVQLERHYSKARILEAYLNLAPYGGSVEGIGTASRIYFDKPASALLPNEALALAVIPQNPSARFPGTAEGRAKLRAARDRLLAIRRASAPPEAPESMARADLEPTFRRPSELPSRAPHFVRDHVAVRGERAIRTTLDLDAQTMLERHIHDHVVRRRRDGITNATAMLIDHQRMEILALVGSADFFDDTIAGQVNGVGAPRSPGSTLKPFLYALALDAGLIHPMTLLEDAPRRYAAYTPENFDRGFLGPVFARDALIHSRNVPAVSLLAELGVKEFRDWLADAGVGNLRQPDEYGLALALGGSEMTMTELVQLYAMLANGGEWRELNAAPGQTGGSPGRRMLSAEASYLVLDMLRDVPRPGAGVSRSQRSPVAWKTGTSFGFRDAWSVGIVDRYVLAVWSGNFDGRGNPALVGREAAAPLFFAIVDNLLARTPARQFAVDQPRRLSDLPRQRHIRQRPGAVGAGAKRRAREAFGGASPALNLRRVEVCSTTGDLPGPHCPSTTRAWFIPGVSPIKVSSVYRAIPIDPATGLRSCRSGPDTRQAVYEFWPSNLHAVFRRAGIAIRQPPAWSPECSLELTAASGQAPRIRSPQPTLVYHAPGVSDDPASMLFSAVADGDARTLFWFVDNHLVGRAAPNENYLWRPRPGRFTVRVVDDLGRADAVSIRVAMPPSPIGA